MIGLFGGKWHSSGEYRKVTHLIYRSQTWFEEDVRVLHRAEGKTPDLRVVDLFWNN